MQEISNFIKRPNLRIMGTEEGEEIQVKGIHNVFNKIITEKFPNLQKGLLIQVPEASRAPNRLEQYRTSPQHIITKTTSTEHRERILTTIREEKAIYRGKTIKITADFSMKTLKSRMPWCEVYWALNENNFSPRILCPAKLLFKIYGAIKIFYDPQKLKKYMTTKPPLQKILQGILHTGNESKKKKKMMGRIKP
jgi:hypothetical protein